MSIEQLEFWADALTEEKCIWTELADIQNQHNNLRKGFFSRHEQLKAEIAILKEEIIGLKKAVEGKGSTEIYELEFFKMAK